MRGGGGWGDVLTCRSNGSFIGTSGHALMDALALSCMSQLAGPHGPVELCSNHLVIRLHLFLGPSLSGFVIWLEKASSRFGQSVPPCPPASPPGNRLLCCCKSLGLFQCKFIHVSRQASSALGLGFPLCTREGGPMCPRVSPLLRSVSNVCTPRTPPGTPSPCVLPLPTHFLGPWAGQEGGADGMIDPGSRVSCFDVAHKHHRLPTG